MMTIVKNIYVEYGNICFKSIMVDLLKKKVDRIDNCYKSYEYITLKR